MTSEEFLDSYLEDHGYGNWDLLLTVVENVVKDTADYWGMDVHYGAGLRGDKGFLLPMYRLFGELIIKDRQFVMQYLPKENSIYEDEYVGGLRD
tara:strand:- start:4376 stop:4657 length:282 start_codon:yes stop_codon:yes gene_type:complete